MSIETPQKNSKRKYWLTALSILFIIIIFIYIIYWFFVSQFYETTDDAYVAGNLVQVMPQINGRVIGIFADETDLVKKGSVLVKLDKTDAEISLKNAESQLALTVRQVNDLYKNVAELRANVAMKENNLTKTQDDYKRRQGLVVTKVISAEDLQHSQIAANSAQADLDLAQSQLASAMGLVANTDLYHHPQIEQAEARLRDAYLALKRTTIYAPEEGYVAKRPVQVGQQVGTNTILMIIVPLDQLWVTANFKESQIEHFYIGQPANIISDIYGNTIHYHGKVIGLSPGTGSAFDLLPPQNATGNWIKIIQRLPVRIALNSAELKKYPLSIGLSMTVTVDTHHRTGKRLSTLSKASLSKVIYATENYGDELKEADQLIEQILKANAANTSIPNE